MDQAPISLEEAARELLRTRDLEPRHVGFRGDLWDCLRACLADLPPAPATWTEWHGGDEPPPDAIGKVVDIITEQSLGALTGPADVWNWSHDGHITRILRYRINAEQPGA